MTAKKSKSQSALGLELGMTDTVQADPAAAGLEYIELNVVIKDIDLQDGQTDEHETTTFASDAKEYEGGLSDSANVTLSGNWAQTDPAHKALMKAKADAGLRAFQIKHKDGSTGKFLAFVKQYTYKASAGGVLAATFAVRVSGLVIWSDAPVTP
jgi:hypothetical protein